MKKIIGFIVLAVVVVFLVIGIIRSRAVEEVDSISEIQQREGVPILAEKAKKQTVTLNRSFYGTIRAANQTTVSAKLMERIDSIPVKVGQRVEKDEVLVRFDTSATQASVTQLRLALEDAEKDYQRMQALYEKGAVSKQTLEKTELNYRVTEENYRTARRMVNLLAPISGTVARIDMVEGDVAMPGVVIMTIVSNNRYEVEFDITAEDRDNVRQGQEVIVRIDSGEKVRGRIRDVSISTRERERMFPVIATIPATKGFHPGMLATIEVTLSEAEDVLAVPNDAILDRGKGPFVFVVRDDKVAMRSVRTGIRGENVSQVLEGLQPGEMIAVYGHKALEDGAKVKLVKED